MKNVKVVHPSPRLMRARREAAAAADAWASVMPFVIGIMIASSMSVATPIGYPTNLMVYGPGGYHFSDYLRLGGPLSLLILVLSVVLIPWFWSF